MAGVDEAENGNDTSRKWEMRAKGGRSQAGGHQPAVVIGVLLDHGDREGGQGVPLLGRIQPPGHALDRVHRLTAIPSAWRIALAHLTTGRAVDGALQPTPVALALR